MRKTSTCLPICKDSLKIIVNGKDVEMMKLMIHHTFIYKHDNTAYTFSVFRGHREIFIMVALVVALLGFLALVNSAPVQASEILELYLTAVYVRA